VKTSAGIGRGQDLLIIEGGPEALFRVTRPSEDGVTVRSAMPEGPWLTGPDGHLAAGALGVLIDNVLGYALMLRRPPNSWSVSAEISLDMCGLDRPGRPPDGLRLISAEASTDYHDETGGVASGAVTDDAGGLLALCRQHGRWVPTVPGSPPEGRQPPSPSALGSAGLAGVLGLPDVADGGAYLDFPVTGDLVNPLATLHGGITLGVCELVARAAVGTGGGPWRTASIHATYPRPLPVGTIVRFEARVRHRGRAFAVIQVTATNGEGKPCVIATVTAGVPQRG
jgi:uncharacterized protein (TIGR00369 family)